MSSEPPTAADAARSRDGAAAENISLKGGILRRDSYLDSDSFALLPFAAVVVSLVASIVTGQWHWFARSGSLVTVGGIILSGRAILRNSIWDDVRVDTGELTDKDLTAREGANRWVDLHQAKLGLFYALTGTVIWGYGDLIGVLLQPPNP